MVKNMFVLQEQLKKELEDLVNQKVFYQLVLGCEAKYAKDFVYTEN